MTSGGLNVRLDAERLRKARILQVHGIGLSDVVRQAIDERFRELRAGPRPDIKALIRRVFERCPDLADLPPLDYEVHDRGTARTAIADKLGRVR